MSDLPEIHKPLVSIIIPCYNAGLWITDCLDSAIAQSYHPLEIIVIDDGSTDNSLDIIRGYAQAYPNLITYERGPNRGGCAARNQGFAISKGQYVFFHDADDFMKADTIAAMVEQIAGSTSSIGRCPYWFYVEQADGTYQITNQWQFDPPSSDLLMSRLMGWEGHINLWPRDLIIQLGGWDEELKIEQDFDLLLRALVAGVDIKSTRTGGYFWRRPLGVATVSSNLASVPLPSLYRVNRKLEKGLLKVERLATYKVILAKRYIALAQRSAGINNRLSLLCDRRARRLAGIKAFAEGSFMNRIGCYLLTVPLKERLAGSLARAGFGRKARVQNQRVPHMLRLQR